MNSSQLLDQLFDAGQIRLQRCSLFDTTPPPLPQDLSWDRIEGMLLGLAIGDALGRTSEALYPHVRQARHGEIRDYLPHPRLGSAPLGLPSVLYILCRHGEDPEEAIVRAVNDTWDNDTIAAIVGAAVGALHGRSALPERWVQGLLGRTAEDDDGRVFELIVQARERWE